jgi:hypothetical protein
MMEWLTAVEGSGFAIWVRESNSIWAYPTVLTLHTVGLGLLVGANWALDLRLLGVGPNIPLAPLRRLFPAMWIGFWLNAVTGVMLFAAEATTKGTTTIFMVKLGLVAVAVAVMRLTERSVYGRGLPIAAVTGTARALAAVSVVLWMAAIATGRFMAYVSV